MFTIDLLKGSGSPVKIKPAQTLILLVLFILPVLIFSLICLSFLRNSACIRRHKGYVRNLEAANKEMVSDIGHYDKLTSRSKAIKEYLQQISEKLNNNMQWTPVLVGVAECLPDSVVLSKLDVRITNIKEKVTDPKNPDKYSFRNNIKRIIKISAYCPSSGSCDSNIRDYLQVLRSQSEASSLIEDVQIVAQKNDVYKDRDVLTYDIDCLFNNRGK
ncbi:MAG: hypothetical protein ABIG61_17570 [Planctomycetota bacterium]